MQIEVAELAHERNSLNEYGNALAPERQDDEVALLKEMRRFNHSRSQGFAANDRGDTRAALAAFLEAARIRPTCAMLLSVANMHLKLGHATSAAPIYRFVHASPQASTRERSMADAKLQLALASPLPEGLQNISPSPLSHGPCRTPAPPNPARLCVAYPSNFPSLEKIFDQNLNFF